MKKILIITSLCFFISAHIYAQKRNITIFDKTDKYKSYIDTINSWNIEKQLESLNIENLDYNTIQNLNSINHFRDSLGLPIFIYDKHLSLAAKTQSYYCSMILLSHINNSSIQLKNPKDRYIFSISISHIKPLVIGKENCGNATNDIKQSYFYSKEYLSNILNREYTHIGIFINKNNNVIVFGKDESIKIDTTLPNYTLKSNFITNFVEKENQKINYNQYIIDIKHIEYNTEKNKIIIKTKDNKTFDFRKENNKVILKDIKEYKY